MNVFWPCPHSNSFTTPPPQPPLLPPPTPPPPPPPPPPPCPACQLPAAACPGASLAMSPPSCTVCATPFAVGAVPYPEVAEEPAEVWTPPGYPVDASIALPSHSGCQSEPCNGLNASRSRAEKRSISLESARFLVALASPRSSSRRSRSTIFARHIRAAPHSCVSRSRLVLRCRSTSERLQHATHCTTPTYATHCTTTT